MVTEPYDHFRVEGSKNPNSEKKKIAARTLKQALRALFDLLPTALELVDDIEIIKG